MKKNKLDVCGLLETKMLPARIASMHARRLKHWQYLSNAELAHTARIVLFWNPDTVHVTLLASSAQAIHISITCLISHVSFKATFVYGFNSITARRPLWEELRSWNSNHPWLILGDFNSLLSPFDKHNGGAISSYEVSDFSGCCLDIGLRDVNYTGCHYTWSNDTVWKAFSDHSPAVVRLDPYVQGRRSFKFFNMWAAHDQFLGVVSSCWSSSIYGTPMYILCRKLKLLKGPLKELNRLHFSHISERVSRLESQLDQLQTTFQQDRDNPLLLEQDKLLRHKLSSLKFAENQFFRQKIKCQFLKDSDRGSKFFHALMGHNHRRNFIPSITCSNGWTTTSLKEVGDAFVSYYQQLLGTPKPTIPLDRDIIQRGPCLSSHLQGALLSPVSQDDIQQVVFSIANEKAPGPDRYSSFFFKQAWPIVGGDFCAAIQDFFHTSWLLKQKVLSKILASRFAQVLHEMVSPMQNAFLGGRYMSDNINLVQELLRQYCRKRSSPRCLLKVDFKKAFDSVQWDFLESLLCHIGFPAHFVVLVMQCISSASYSVAVNGDIHGFFSGQCGWLHLVDPGATLFVPFVESHHHGSGCYLSTLWGLRGGECLYDEKLG
uniref:Reverse transcriptase domain-containing protein n=1 Tax=Populus alba TaxID=43335 RepID=A0A4U5QFT2_POPAL|nr:hypothetical protein D5086_0000108870 [Populus alba]